MLKKISGILHYFHYFRSITGNRIYLLLLINILVGLTDGLGIAMFVPIISQITLATVAHEHLGKLQYFTEFLERIGIDLNLYNLLLLMIVIFSIKAAFSYFRSIYFQKIKLEAVRNLRLEMVSKMRHANYYSFTRINAGEVQNAMHAEIIRLVDSMSNYVKTIEFLVVMLTYFALAFYVNWEFAILVSLAGIFAMFFYNHINRLTKRESQRLSHAGNQYQGKVLQAVNNFKYLKATNVFQKYEAKLRHDIEEIEQSNFQMGKFQAIVENIKEPFIITIISIVIFVQLWVFKSNIATIIIGLLLFFRALTYLMSLQVSWNRFLAGAAAINTIENIRKLLTQDAEPASEAGQHIDIGSIQLRDVGVSSAKKQILHNINLTIPKHHTIALIGESGAGKTTLANVISGLVLPSTGEILYNNAPIPAKHSQALRSQVGYIAQEQHIFDDTLFNNVTLWAQPNAENLAKFQEVIKLVSLDNFVENLPLGAETRLGHQGVIISGGQKQRINIARELYRDVQLLIFDEATSSLDSETEYVIQKNIEKLHGKYTIVIIAHRISTVKNADMIVVLDNGKIVAQNDYDSLYEENPMFRRMIQSQQL